MQLIGTTLGQYRITEQIGEGGMATVYKAYQPSLDRFVAIKVLAPLHARTPGFKERFFREARAVAQLSHPNILPVYDVATENDICYLVMKCISGSSMRDIMGEKMDLSRICRFIDQVASALDHAHGRGIIHRDIKSHNLLLEGDWVFLTDFGIAKIMEASTVLTSTGELIGTPCYMSPEQAKGKPVDHRTDIYSLGIVIYEMITGTVPFKGETPYGVIYKQIHEPLPLPRSYRPDLPEEVERVVLKALAKSPDHRFDRAGLLAAALRDAVTVSLQNATTEVLGLSASLDDDFSTQSIPKAASPGETRPVAAPSPLRATESAGSGDRGVSRKALFLSVSLLLLFAGIIGAVFHFGDFFRNRPSGAPQTYQGVQAPSPSPVAALQLESNPPAAAIHLDGNRVGTTPWRLDLPLGEHHVRLELAGYQGWEDVLRLLEPGEYPVKVDLKPVLRMASLKIASTPDGADVFVDNELRGQSPLESELPLGTHSIRLSRGGYKDSERTLTLSEAKSYELIVELVRSDTPAPPAPPPEAAPATDTPPARYEQGRWFFENGKHKEAFESFMTAASLGHVESQNEVGYMLMHGLGVKKNPKEATSWLRKAAAQGYAASQNNLGILYLKGEAGVRQDDREAFSWFRMAAEQGNRDGQFYLASMYRYGRGRDADLDQAVDWYRKAAAQGHEEAAKALKALGK
ncbi:MAG: protein kinase [Syntrophobacteraceae bacterium]